MRIRGVKWWWMVKYGKLVTPCTRYPGVVVRIILSISFVRDDGGYRPSLPFQYLDNPFVYSFFSFLSVLCTTLSPPPQSPSTYDSHLGFHRMTHTTCIYIT